MSITSYFKAAAAATTVALGLMFALSPVAHAADLPMHAPVKHAVVLKHHHFHKKHHHKHFVTSYRNQVPVYKGPATPVVAQRPVTDICRTSNFFEVFFPRCGANNTPPAHISVHKATPPTPPEHCNHPAPPPCHQPGGGWGWGKSGTATGTMHHGMGDHGHDGGKSNNGGGDHGPGRGGGMSGCGNQRGGSGGAHSGPK